MTQDRKVTAIIEAPGYRTETSFPLGVDAREAFCAWFEMQLNYLGRWKPGSTAAISEQTPTALKVAVCEYLLRVNEEHDGPFIPPTAINWLGDGIVTAVLSALTDDHRDPAPVSNGPDAARVSAPGPTPYSEVSRG